MIILEAEPILPEVEPLDQIRNELIREHNKMLQNLIPDNGIGFRIYRMSVNSKTMFNLENEPMLPDRIHLADKNILTTIPRSIPQVRKMF